MKSNFLLLLFLSHLSLANEKNIRLNTVLIEAKSKTSIQVIESQEFLEKIAFQIVLEDFTQIENTFISTLSKKENLPQTTGETTGEIK